MSASDVKQKVKCAICGAVTAGRMPRVKGNNASKERTLVKNIFGDVRYPSRHQGPNGKPCAGARMKGVMVEE